MTPLIGVLQDEAVHFCTGLREQKARNLEGHRQVALTTGNNAWAQGLDVVVEGTATRVTERAALQRLADAYEAKYGSEGISTSVTACSGRVRMPPPCSGSSRQRYWRSQSSRTHRRLTLRHPGVPGPLNAAAARAAGRRQSGGGWRLMYRVGYRTRQTPGSR